MSFSIRHPVQAHSVQLSIKYRPANHCWPHIDGSAHILLQAFLLADEPALLMAVVSMVHNTDYQVWLLYVCYELAREHSSASIVGGDGWVWGFRLT